MEIEQYMEAKSQELESAYPENGCQKIATEVASLLIEEGREAEILTFEKIGKN